MQITPLIVPSAYKKISFEITNNGEIIVSRNQPEKKENMLANLFGKWEGCKIQLGHLNSIQLTKNNKFQDMLKDNPFVSIQTSQAPLSQSSRTIKCHCKKSKCLKLYCQCFSNQLYCNSECQCQCCANQEINAKRLQILRQEMSTKKMHDDRGCKCSKSNCLKKYCDCYNRGVACGPLCACENCSNCFNQTNN